jgi:hypothetical protein
MTTASDLVRPAAEPMAEPILEEFGEDALEFTFRQYVGHRIRHTMAVLDYEIDQLDVRIPRGPLFTRAARYRKKALTLALAR